MVRPASKTRVFVAVRRLGGVEKRREEVEKQSGEGRRRDCAQKTILITIPAAIKYSHPVSAMKT